MSFFSRAFRAVRVSLLVVVSGPFVAAACATNHTETRDECGQRCNGQYEACSQHAYGSDSLHGCALQVQQCSAFCPSK